MANTLTLARLESYQALLNEGSIGEFYTLMLANGYGYAGWARGVAEEDSISGLAALDFLSDSAMYGIAGLDPTEVTPEQFQNIKRDMAQGYLNTLKDIARENGSVDRDVTAGEVWDFHRNVFQSNGLNIESWTLHAPFTIVQDYFGDAELENFWQETRDTGGQGLDAVLGNLKISLLMYTAAHGPMGAANASLANQWLDLVGFDGSIVPGLHGGANCCA